MIKAVILGKDIQSGRDVFLTEEARKLSTYILGKIGTGKSTLLEAIAYQDMVNGAGLCFIDPHQDSVNRLLEGVPESRAGDVVFYDPTDVEQPFGMNPFFCPTPKNLLAVTGVAQNFVEALGSLEEFAEVFGSAPRMKIVLHNLALTFVVNQGSTLIEAPKFLTDEKYRRQFYGALADDHYTILEFWQRLDERTDHAQMEIVGSSLNKLERFSADPIMRAIFGQPTNSIDFRKAMDEGKIVLVKLSGSSIGGDNAAFIGAFLVSGIFQALMERPPGERKQFHLIADEFQRFMTTTFPRLQEESRKFGVDTTVAHQNRASLNQRSRASTLVVGNKILFGITGADAAELASEFDLTPPPPEIKQESKLGIPAEPWTLLKNGGHPDQNVMSLVSWLKKTLMDIQWHLVKIDVSNIAPFTSSAQRSLGMPGDLIGEVRAYLQASAGRIDYWVNEYLRRRMQGESQESVMDLLKEVVRNYIFLNWAGGEKIEEPDQKLFERLNKATEEFEEVKRQLSIETDHLKKTSLEVKRNKAEDEKIQSGSSYRQQKEKFDRAMDLGTRFMHLTIALGDELAAHPLQVHTAEFEAKYDKPRLYNDVGAEKANQLATLPRYTAWCRIVTENGEATEFKIKTQLPSMTPYKEERVNQMKKVSRQVYGRERAAVEKAIAKRLQQESKPIKPSIYE